MRNWKLITYRKLYKAIDKTIANAKRYAVRRPLICFTKDVNLWCDDCPFCEDGQCRSPMWTAEEWKKYLKDFEDEHGR